MLLKSRLKNLMSKVNKKIFLIIWILTRIMKTSQFQILNAIMSKLLPHNKSLMSKTLLTINSSFSSNYNRLNKLLKRNMTKSQVLLVKGLKRIVQKTAAIWISTIID